VSQVNFKDYLSILCSGEQLLPDAPRVQGDPVPGRTLSRRPALASGGGFFMDIGLIDRFWSLPFLKPRVYTIVHNQD
jgi:hypothetical protein